MPLSPVRFHTAVQAGIVVLLFAACGESTPPAPVPTQLAVITQPAGAASGAPLTTQPVVQLRDAAGADVALAGVNVTASIASGGGTLGGTATMATAANGRATFTNLSISGTAGAARTIQFAAQGLTSATSSGLNLDAGDAAALVITVQPSAIAQSGLVLAQQPEVQVQDNAGNDVAEAGLIIGLTLASGNGTVSVPAPPTTDANGHAVFMNVSISGLVGARTLRFATGSLTAAVSSSIDLQAGAASVLVLTTQPSGTAMDGVPFQQQPRVQVRDVAGNPVPEAGIDITPSIASGPGTLSPLTPVPTDATGVAIFSGLMITGTGTHTLGFGATNFNPIASGDIVVSVQFPCAQTTPGDTDGDRLPNCVETNTGVFVGATTDTGTDPNDTDTDNDAIADGDETIGTLGGLDLPAMGTNPLKRNILIEYDWFDDNLDPGTCAAHSHRPTAAIITAVANAFAASPVTNPDGTTGITMIQDYGQGGAFTGGNLIADPDGIFSTGQGVNGAEFQTHKNANFATNRNGYFHYSINPHRYDGPGGQSSGQAELPGDDMIVSLYCFGSTTNVANTIVHELGHNLLLRHGGNVDTNWKPNYNSVMNYLYQFPGIDNDCVNPGDGVLSYSIGARPVLNENSLDETQGICGNPPGPGRDWNADGDATDVGVVRDINNNGPGDPSTIDGLFQSLTDHNDWANFVFTGITDGDGAPLTARPFVAKQVVTCTNVPPQAAAAARRK